MHNKINPAERYAQADFDVGIEYYSEVFMGDELNARFELAMRDIYRRARLEAHYNATRYLQMLDQNGDVETAHILINAPTVSDGYTALWERRRLDLTVEALIWDNPEYQEMFTANELKIIRMRLVDYEYVSK